MACRPEAGIDGRSFKSDEELINRKQIPLTYEFAASTLGQLLEAAEEVRGKFNQGSF